VALGWLLLNVDGDIAVAPRKFGKGESLDPGDDGCNSSLASALVHLGQFEVASIHAFRGEADRAFEWLDRAVAARDGGVTELLEDLFLLALTGDPRFARLRKNAGLPAAD
jgi:hypothetical protein